MSALCNVRCRLTKQPTTHAELMSLLMFLLTRSYDAIESVESRMQEVLSPTPEGDYVGSALVQEVFNIGGTGNIAGSKCRDGIIKKGSNVRILRGDKILSESKVKTLRNFKVSKSLMEL